MCVGDAQVFSDGTSLFSFSSDREIQFFELSSFEAYCQISGLPTVPLKLDYW